MNRYKGEDIYNTNNIKWEWEENFEKAEAVLICENDETHQERINATVVSKDKTHTATITYNNVEYIDTIKANRVIKYTLSSDKTYYSVDGLGTCRETDIIIPSEYNGLPVIRINNHTFKECNYIINITLPDSVTNIGNYAFDGCNSLKSIGDYAFFGCISLTAIHLPNSITSIGDNAFANCASLTNITLPDNITSMGYSVFSSCVNLQYNEYGNC